MDSPYINIHTHRRAGEEVGTGSAAGAGLAAAEEAADVIEVVSVMAGHGISLPAPPFSIGIHPWQVDDEEEISEALLEVESATAAAIGEIGLDYATVIGWGTESYSDDHADRDDQKAVFAAQLRIAQKRRLPVVLHCVRAFEPTCKILAAYGDLEAVIFHGFIGSPEQAARAVRAGYYLSFGERSLTSPRTVESLRRMPLDRIFLETDQEPIHISEIYSRAAEILAIPVARLKEQLYDNYMTIFER